MHPLPCYLCVVSCMYTLMYTSLAAVASLWVAPHAPPAAGGVLAPTPRSHLWLGAPGPRHAVAVHRPTHRRAARAGGIACSTHCRELERLAWSSPPATCSSAYRRHAPCSIRCRLELTWSSPPTDSACLRHAGCNAACRLTQLPWGSPRAGNACPRRVRCNVVCRLEPPWNNPPPDNACPLHVPDSAACLL
jgi:hypothetical protein